MPGFSESVITVVSLLVFLIVMEADAQLCITSLYILDILNYDFHSRVDECEVAVSVYWL